MRRKPWQRALLVVLMVAAMLSTAGARFDVPLTNDTVVKAYPLVFPVAGDHSYVDTFGAPRSGGRTHKGTDIFAAKLTPVVAAADGTVIRIAIGKLAGRYIVVLHTDGWRSYYIHLNNDTPGTDDGRGGASAPGIAVGVRVAAGDVLDYIGDSGNAEETPSHLHFELHDPHGAAVNPEPHLRAAEAVAASSSTGTEWPAPARPDSYRTSGTEVVGHFDPGAGFAAGLAVHNDVAYLGTWGRPTVCPGFGVRLIDLADPAEPRLMATIAANGDFPGTSTDSIWVGEVESEAFTGDLAIVAVRLCDTRERHRRSGDFRGLALYDVTDSAQPELLSTVHSGEWTQGANEVTAAVRPDGSFVIAATVMQSLLHTNGSIGDFRLIDATDPLHPVPVSNWDVRRDLLLDPARDPVDPVELHVHSVWLAPDGMTAWLAAWDAGLVMLDLTSPAQPRIGAHVPVGVGTGGNAHTVFFDLGSGLLIRNDEILDPGGDEPISAGWGAQTIYDASDLADVIRVATFDPVAADGNAGEVDRSGFFSAHEVEVVDGIEYVSWYSQGVRVVDLTDPAQPVELGSFVPPTASDPQGHWVAPDGSRSFPLVWGVEVVDGVVYLSDMHSGLWIVRYVPPAPEPAVPGEADESDGLRAR
jgi:hypothetical protein